jgi:hypothetical protein
VSSRISDDNEAIFEATMIGIVELSDFPILSCTQCQDGLIICGGGGGNNAASFLGTPIHILHASPLPSK